MPCKKYSNQSKEWFFKCLTNYREALARGTKHDIIMTSLQVYAALAGVPTSYKRYVNAAYKGVVREVPLGE
jgi:hypothetical protein